MSSADRIRELLELMEGHELVELQLEEPEFKIKLRKAGAQAPLLAPVPAPAAAPAPTAPVATSAGTPEDDEGLTPITSPIVGTFYRAPSPEAEAFVNEGARVDSETVVCIIEAMKIMNEIKAGMKGTIARILMENGEPVEYGQPLFLVRQ